MSLETIWKSISLTILGALIGGAPGYFIVGPNKPDRIEVSNMIQKEAPRAVYGDLIKIRDAQERASVQLGVLTQKVELLAELLREERNK